MPDIECAGVAVISIDKYLRVGVYGDKARLKKGAKVLAQCFDSIFQEVLND